MCTESVLQIPCYNIVYIVIVSVPMDKRNVNSTKPNLKKKINFHDRFLTFLKGKRVVDAARLEITPWAVCPCIFPSTASLVQHTALVTLPQSAAGENYRVFFFHWASAIKS